LAGQTKTKGRSESGRNTDMSLDPNKVSNANQAAGRDSKKKSTQQSGGSLRVGYNSNARLSVTEHVARDSSGSFVNVGANSNNTLQITEHRNQTSGTHYNILSPMSHLMSDYNVGKIKIRKSLGSRNSKRQAAGVGNQGQNNQAGGGNVQPREKQIAKGSRQAVQDNSIGGNGKINKCHTMRCQER